MLAAAAVAAWLMPAAALGFAGSFRVCDRAPQYVRVEVVDGFPPFDCPAVAWEAGNPLPAILTISGLAFYASCALYAPGGERARLMISLRSPDAVIGHELRHAFPPHEFHLPAVPFFDLPCDWQH